MYRRNSKWQCSLFVHRLSQLKHPKSKQANKKQTNKQTNKQPYNLFNIYIVRGGRKIIAQQLINK
jgi:hypothetical protein